MPIHFMITYSGGTVQSACHQHDPASPLRLETGFPDLFEHDINGMPQNVEAITVIFSQDSGQYPEKVTISGWTSHNHIYTDAPSCTSASPTSGVAIVDRSGQNFGIRVTPPNTDDEEEWNFTNSECKDPDTGQSTSCLLPIVQPKKLTIKVKRQQSYSCPS